MKFAQLFEDKFKTIVAIVLVVAAFPIGSIGLNNIRLMNNEKDESLAKIFELKEELKKAKEEKAVTDKVAEATYHSATDVGTKVAFLQNKLMKATLGSEDLSSVAKDLREYFEDDAKGAANVWFSGTGGTWTYVSTLSYPDKKFDVVFKCMNSEGKLLAMAVSQYDSDTKLLGPVTVYTTSYGSKTIKAD